MLNHPACVALWLAHLQLECLAVAIQLYIDDADDCEDAAGLCRRIADVSLTVERALREASEAVSDPQIEAGR